MLRGFGSVVVMALVAGMMWHCGGERVMMEVDEQVGQPLSKLAVQNNASGAVVVAFVRQDDAPISGAMVEFARSIAGQVAEYAWSGMTDEDGRVRLEIAGDATGYYQARASQDGRVIGSWSSIPINAGDEVVVNLPVGRKAQVTRTPVVIPDANLRAIIADSLGKASGEAITAAEMATLTRLDAPNKYIHDLTGLEFATNLTRLDLGTERVNREYVNSNLISDFSTLSSLTSLERLDLGGNYLSDISPLISSLSSLTSLEQLDLSDNSISDISSLSSLTNLERLYLSDNSISDISSLSSLTSLERLTLSLNSISDISSLSSLTNLTWLSLIGNDISDISSLSNLTNLEWLTLTGNDISDITPLSNLTNLRTLWLQRNSISDISSLSSLTNLTWLNLSDNSISDISSLSSLTNLRSLWFVRNSISDVSALSGLTSLRQLLIYNCSISDLAPLVANTGLGSGDRVDVRNNPLSATSINAHIPALQSRGVEVRFSASKPAVQENEDLRDMLGEAMKSFGDEEWKAEEYIYNRGNVDRLERR